jgi:hypothetical protein
MTDALGVRNSVFSIMVAAAIVTSCSSSSVAPSQTEATRLCLLKIPYLLRPLMFGSSLDTLPGNDFRPVLAGPCYLKWPPFACRTAA